MSDASSAFPIAHCRSCGAPIIWALTASGRRMPVDAHVHSKGTLVVFVDHEVVRVRVEAYVDGQARHRPHFATCPDAEGWRKR